MVVFLRNPLSQGVWVRRPPVRSPALGPRPGRRPWRRERDAEGCRSRPRGFIYTYRGVGGVGEGCEEGAGRGGGGVGRSAGLSRGAGRQGGRLRPGSAVRRFFCIQNYLPTINYEIKTKIRV